MTGNDAGRRPVGRPRVASDELVGLIDRMNKAGQSFETIAQWLTEARIPTPGGPADVAQQMRVERGEQRQRQEVSR
ncbi:hypothetical protein GFY24_09145 [Nocardia sp. SYP-A9097]|uniref:hypothetical protein n=1 Tax=Nocardia sp. SYP-A9097 TaxID=2663237 RepID=UPI00129AB9BB|nr:hypothetical protein [Nocardia sp. SYP-A9097]MRH87617.1 hypothetical protein [Nocardia sp. SYP-A9097]